MKREIVVTLLSVLFLSFSSSTLAIQCYVGVVGFNPEAKECIAGTCAQYLQNGQRALGCFSYSTCLTLQDSFCCQQELCNLDTGGGGIKPTLSPVASKFSNARPLIRRSSTWSYYDSGALSGEEWYKDLVIDESNWKKAKGPFGYQGANEPSFVTTRIETTNSTVAFRQIFDLTEEERSSSIRFVVRVLFSDGVKIYLNGKQVYSNNLPTSSSYTTFANSDRSEWDKYETFSIDLVEQRSSVRLNENIMSVEVHKSSNLDDTLSFDMDAYIVVATQTPFSRHRSLNNKGGSWFTKVDGANTFSQSGFFTSSLFNLETYPFLASPFSNSVNPLSLNGTNPIYLRTTVSRNSQWNVTDLHINIRSDNGFIVYVGGKELLRYNLPTNSTIGHFSKSLAEARSTHKNVYRHFSGLDHTIFSNGNNILVVVLFHANGETVPNYSFDMELLMTSAESSCQSFDVAQAQGSTFPYNYPYKQSPCVFPFIYNGKSYSTCISNERSAPWCSLTSNYDMDGLWGYCNNCTSSCMFPFTIGITSYQQCVNIAEDKSNNWCLTNVKADSWAYCSPPGLVYTAPTQAPTQAPTITPPTDAPETNDGKFPMGAIIGVAVGMGLLAIFLVVGLIVYLVKQGKKDQEIAQIIAESRSNGSGTQISFASTTKLSTTQGTQISMSNKQFNDSKVSQYSYKQNGPKQNIFPQVNNSDLNVEGQTLLNTQMEKALPGFLMLTDLSEQIRINRVISKGGNGILYEGVIVDPTLRDRSGYEKVAVKKIEYPEALQDREVEAFHHEITAMWSVSFHPNVLKLIAYDDPTRTIITPLYDGDLDFFLHKTPEPLVLSDGMILHIVFSIAKGLNEMHNFSIIHRDVKSSNVLLRFNDDGNYPEVVICDFGISRIANNHDLVNQKKLELFGLSPRYAAPEIFARSYTKSEGDVNPEIEMRSDVFAYGVIVWEVLSRRVPWEGYDLSQIEMNVRSGKTLPDPPVPTALKQSLFSLVRTCRAQEPLERPRFNTIVSNLQLLEPQLSSPRETKVIIN